jgi:hypothetical protein
MSMIYGKNSHNKPKNNKKTFLLGSKNGTSQNTAYAVKKFCAIINKKSAKFLNPNCAFVYSGLVI